VKERLCAFAENEFLCNWFYSYKCIRGRKWICSVQLLFRSLAEKEYNFFNESQFVRAACS
jgi:hypothetical protein